MLCCLNKVIYETCNVNKLKRDSKKINVNKNLLSYAIVRGNLEKVKLLVQQGVNVNDPGRNKLPPLHLAAKYGRDKVIKFLIKNGASLDTTLEGPRQRGYTPLHLAVTKNHFNTAKLLLEYGASTLSKIKGVWNPIHIAVFSNSLEMTSLLLTHGAEINLKFDNKFFEEFKPNMHRSLWLDHNLPLLHFSILRDFRSMTKLLVTCGADVNLKTSLGKTTLMQAVEVSNSSLVRFLIKKKNANVNDQDIYGQPVLHFLILNAKTKLSIYNKEEEALGDNKHRILHQLWSHGADLNARFPANEERSSIIHYMIRYGFYRGVYALLFYQKNLNFNEIDLTSIYSAQISSKDITPDIENDDEYLAQIRSNYIDTVNVIVQKAIHDKMIGLPVNENLILEKPIHSCYPVDQYKDRMEEYRNCTMRDINYLKKQKVGDSNITVWHLFTCDMNELVKLMSNKIVKNFNVINDIESEDCDIEDWMPEFVSRLKYRLRVAKKRKQLLEDCSEIIFNLLVPYVPYNCCETIVNNFNNQELIFLHPTWITTEDDDLCITDDDENSPDI